MSQPTPDCVIRNGTVVTATEAVVADLAIHDGRIAAVGHGLSAVTEIDARGLLVMPGGIDPHVHLAYPQGPHRVVSADDWETGTIAAALGGTTTVVDFVEAGPGETWMAAFEARRAEAEAAAAIDFGLHMTFNRGDERSRAEVRDVIAAGVPSFKFYMAYDGLRVDDEALLAGFATLAEHGGLALVHAENHELIRELVEHHRRADHVHPFFHPLAHPAFGEAEATERALALAATVGLPLHVVHVSAAAGLAALARWRAKGDDVSGEVCPQHLLLTDDVYTRPDAEMFVMAPPLRRDEDRAALWQALGDGGLDFVVTDHCPFTRAQKRGLRRTPELRRLTAGSNAGMNPASGPWGLRRERSSSAPRPPSGAVTAEREEPWATSPVPFDRLPGGAPGIETRMALLHHFGVGEGRLSLPRFVEVTSTAAARRFGLYPRKGALVAGADADLVLFDPGHEVVLSARHLHQNVDFTPFEGLRVKGWPRTVLSRGEAIVRDFAWTGARGRGRFLPRRPGERGDQSRAARAGGGAPGRASRPPAAP
ncbi:MAG: amidohydrolase family protein [Vicinamibacteria bacterium]|nr:amidohydrolase family protein [Vicinamibacteria bacterium]